MQQVSNWEADRWAWKRAVFRDARLSDGAKLLATCFCDTFAHHKTGFCNPTVATLGEALSKSERAVQRVLSELRGAGWIEVHHARGRGQTSLILFLTGDDPAAFGAAEKVTRLSASQPERVSDVSPFTPERVTLAVEKGDRCVTPYKDKPKKNQKTQARERGPHERPTPQCYAVAYFGSSRIDDWDAWLVPRGLPKLSAINHLSSDAGGRGYDVPFPRPPRADDRLENRIAMNWAEWARDYPRPRHAD